MARSAGTITCSASPPKPSAAISRSPGFQRLAGECRKSIGAGRVDVRDLLHPQDDGARPLAGPPQCLEHFARNTEKDGPREAKDLDARRQAVAKVGFFLGIESDQPGC